MRRSSLDAPPKIDFRIDPWSPVARLLQIADDIVVGQRIRSEHVIDCAIRVELPEKRARLPLELRLVRRSSLLEFHQHRVVRIASDTRNVDQQRIRLVLGDDVLNRSSNGEERPVVACDKRQALTNEHAIKAIRASADVLELAVEERLELRRAGHRRQRPDAPQASRRVARRGSRTTDSCERPERVFDRCRCAFPDEVVDACGRFLARLPFAVFVFDPEDILETVRDREAAIVARTSGRRARATGASRAAPSRTCRQRARPTSSSARAASTCAAPAAKAAPSPARSRRRASASRSAPPASPPRAARAAPRQTHSCASISRRSFADGLPPELCTRLVSCRSSYASFGASTSF